MLASLVSVFLLAKLFGLNHAQYVTLLPKSITTAIGMGVSEELGGIVTITVAVIIITGILGNMIGEVIFKISVFRSLWQKDCPWGPRPMPSERQKLWSLVRWRAP